MYLEAYKMLSNPAMWMLPKFEPAQALIGEPKGRITMIHIEEFMEKTFHPVVCAVLLS